METLKRRGVQAHACLSVVWVLTACTSPPQIDVAAEADAVRARSEAVAAAEAAMDGEKAITFWAQDAVFQPAGAPQIQGRDSIAGLYKQFFTASGLKSFSGKASQIVVAQAGDLAYETGVNRFTFGTPKGDVLDVGKYLVVWKKINGTWYIAAISTTSDAPMPAPVK